ncbi:MAG: hypothetical protein ACHQVK_03165 [Candidatus Paceibacterales bacterium]
MTTLALHYRATHKKSVAGRFFHVPWKICYGLGLVFCIAMLVLYVVQINTLTKGTYLIKNYHKNISGLTQENVTLETHFAQSGFLGSVQDKVKQLDFQPTTQITYIQVLDNSLGMAK